MEGLAEPLPDQSVREAIDRDGGTGHVPAQPFQLQPHASLDACDKKVQQNP